MSLPDNDPLWPESEDDDDFPDLDTEEGRDRWIEILMAQDEDTEWCKALTVEDGEGNMVLRVIYPGGNEEVFDVKVRRSIEVSKVSEERN